MAAKPDNGLVCPNPKCNKINNFRVVETRQIPHGTHRRHECNACGTRFSSKQRIIIRSVKIRHEPPPNSNTCHSCQHYISSRGFHCDLGLPDYREDGPSAAAYCNNYRRGDEPTP